MKVFKGVNAYVRGKGIVKTDIVFNEKICAFSDNGYNEKIFIPDNCIVVPGFIDEHVHGAGGAEVIDGTVEALRTIAIQLAKSGTTSFLATTVAHCKDKICNAIRVAGKYMKSNYSDGAEILGVNMEGPFLSHEYKGAMRDDCIIKPTIEAFKGFEYTGKGIISMITIAPETDKSNELIKYLKNEGIVVSIGHSNASYEIIEAAIESGASCVTHIYNAQRPLHHREIGVVGSALLCDSLTCEIIADGVHVSYPAIKLLVKNKPKDKIVLITDALRAQGLPLGLSDTGGQTVEIFKDCVRLPNGTLAGSVLPINKMLKNLVENVGVGLTEAIDYATINPAVNLHIENKKGSIEIGKDADFAVLDRDFNVYETIRAGKTIFRERK